MNSQKLSWMYLNNLQNTLLFTCEYSHPWSTLIKGIPLSTQIWTNYSLTNIVCALQHQDSHGALLKFQEKLTRPMPAWRGSAHITQLSGELGWSSACTHYSEHDKCIIFCLIMFNTTAAASLWNLSNTLFLVKSLNTVDFQPSRFSFSNTMLILHNTCSQQTRVSWLEHKHAAIYCAGGSSGLYTQFVSIIFLPVKDWQHNARNGNDSQWPTFPLYYPTLGE